MSTAIILPKIMLPLDSKMLAPLYSSGPDVLHANPTGVGIMYILVYNGHMLILGSDKAEHRRHILPGEKNHYVSSC